MNGVASGTSSTLNISIIWGANVPPWERYEREEAIYFVAGLMATGLKVTSYPRLKRVVVPTYRSDQPETTNTPVESRVKFYGRCTY